ncbi:PREDICTED: slit homolog 1 protein-like [Branchiostoma belcheri]|uniref:Slit homolog 1 protein-like n=1 Tax=Branchiostoma belcheri TaxID=7741 RepID=A0A6P4XGZ9_BRABE|nr:PREDICTED: slit homolog 1 protein-like [Branchiostoma belcheri]
MQTSHVTCRTAAVCVLGLLWVVTAVFTCPEKCGCDGGRTRCDARGFKDVPANIPLETTILSLQYNSIQNLTEVAFSRLTRLKRLYLQDNNISVLPDGVFSHLTSLEWLDLQNNDIRVLPDGVFSHLTRLERLFLQNNNISVLPDGVFSHLTRLKRLYLQNNNISVLPDGVFSHLTSLNDLYLQNNNIRVLPDEVFSHLFSLVWLYLQNNNISVLPDGVFSHLFSLKRLYLQNNNIRVLPDGVFSHIMISSLERLDLQNNDIRVLHDGVFSHLTSLWWLNLQNNNIRVLHDGVFSHLTSLNDLYLQNNNISVLPDEVFSHLTSLVWLYLQNNNIRVLPDGVFSHLTSLERLYLQNNSISVLSNGVFSHLTSLVGLNLQNNNISVLPDGVFSHLTSLVGLNLQNNNISVLSNGVFSHLISLVGLNLQNNNISVLPDGVFSHLTSLVGLNLQNNNISVLPDGVFSHLTSLVGLNLQNNDISVLPDGVFSHLTSLNDLYLQNNDIGILPDGVFSHLTSLERLYLQNNSISVLSNGVFSHLTSLVGLNLQNNNISVLSDGVFSHLTSLERLYLQGNPWRCDCRLQGQMIPSRLRSKIQGNPTCSSPPHMEGVALVHVDTFICHGQGDCTPAEDTCDCNVGWTGPYCDKGKLMVRVGPNEDFTRNDQCGLNYTATLTGRRTVVLHCEPPLPGRYVSVQMVGLPGELNLCEVEVYVTGICCDDTVRIANGQITANDGFCFGEKIQFSCDPGYELVGDFWTTCQKNGSWDREVPKCKRICCDNTIVIPNGQVTGHDGYCSGNAVQFSCDTGYKLDGISFAICQDRKWDREFPTCQRICCDNTTEITNGLVNATDGYCFGNDILFSCNPGYELVGSSLATCQGDGSWGRDIPTCQLPEEQSMEATIAGASASVVAVLIVVAAVFMVLLRRRRRKRKDSLVQVSYFLPDDVIIHNRRLQELAAAPPVPDRPELPGFEVDPSRVTLGERIGSGAFGLAYRATLTTGDKTEDVVVKTLKDAPSEEDRLSFLQEIRAVVALGVQDNVLSLVGCCTVVRDHLYLITEFMPYGDLKNFLRKCRQEEIYDEPRDDIYNFEVKQMYQVARQIARGMDHISRSRYIHGDLAARNVLVGEELKVKISDFGLAEDIYTRGYRRQDRLQRVPWKWMAPERLEDGKAYTTRSDVWSFGIVLYEISTLGGEPYPDVAIAHLKDRLQAGFRMPNPEGCPPGMYDLMLQCWRWQPAERPSFRNLELDLDSQLAFYGPEYARTAPATGTAPKPTA